MIRHRVHPPAFRVDSGLGHAAERIPTEVVAGAVVERVVGTVGVRVRSQAGDIRFMIARFEGLAGPHAALYSVEGFDCEPRAGLILGGPTGANHHEAVHRCATGAGRTDHRPQGQCGAAAYDFHFFDGHHRHGPQNARRHCRLQHRAVDDPAEIGIAPDAQAAETFAAAVGGDHAGCVVEQFKHIARTQLFDLCAGDGLGMLLAAFGSEILDLSAQAGDDDSIEGVGIRFGSESAIGGQSAGNSKCQARETRPGMGREEHRYLRNRDERGYRRAKGLFARFRGSSAVRETRDHRDAVPHRPDRPMSVAGASAPSVPAETAEPEHAVSAWPTVGSRRIRRLTTVYAESPRHRKKPRRADISDRPQCRRRPRRLQRRPDVPPDAIGRTSAS